MNDVALLKKYNKPGVCVIFSGKSCYVLNSGNILGSIINILPKLNDVDRISLFEPCTDETLRSIKAGWYAGQYKDKGYKICGNVAKWNIRVVVRNTRVNNRSGAPISHMCFVEAYSSYNTLVLGVFRTRPEALSWRKQCCKDLRNVVICMNECTREWYKPSG